MASNRRQQGSAVSQDQHASPPTHRISKFSEEPVNERNGDFDMEVLEQPASFYGDEELEIPERRPEVRERYTSSSRDRRPRSVTPLRTRAEPAAEPGSRASPIPSGDRKRHLVEDGRRKEERKKEERSRTPIQHREVAVEDGSRTRVEDGRRIRDRHLVDDRPRVRDRHQVEEGSRIRERHPVEDGPRARERQPVEDGPRVRERHPVDNGSRLRERHPAEDGHRSRERHSVEDGHRNRERQPLGDGNRSRERHPVEDGPRSREREPVENGPRTRDRPVVEESPIIRERHSVEKERSRTPIYHKEVDDGSKIREKDVTLEMKDRSNTPIFDREVEDVPKTRERLSAEDAPRRREHGRTPVHNREIVEDGPSRKRERTSVDDVPRKRERSSGDDDVRRNERSRTPIHQREVEDAVRQAERSRTPIHRERSPMPRRSPSPEPSSRRTRTPVLRRGSPRRSPRRGRSPGGRGSPRRRSSPSRRDRGSRRDRRSPAGRRGWSPVQNRSNGVGKPGNNLFIAGFNFITTEKDLERKFSRYGRVMDVRIVRDKRSGESRGFGFLTLERDEDADAAIKSLDQTEWNGRIVLVEKAKTPTRF